MKRIFSILVFSLALWLADGAYAVNTFAPERLNYEVVYEWGMVWKHAANATWTISKSGNGYVAQLVGYTRSWADKIYPVRDTLRCTMDANLKPLLYEKFTHEDKYYARDNVKYSYPLGKTVAKCTRQRPDRADKPDVNIELMARAQAYDMVSVFYMLRNVDYASMKKGDIISTIIFSGKQKEYLTVTYRGVESVKLRDKSKHEAYCLTFRFTQEGGKKSSENITVWFSTDSRCVPLKFEGRLAVGAVKCYLKQ